MLVVTDDRAVICPPQPQDIKAFGSQLGEFRSPTRAGSPFSHPTLFSRIWGLNRPFRALRLHTDPCPHAAPHPVKHLQLFSALVLFTWTWIRVPPPPCPKGPSRGQPQKQRGTPRRHLPPWPRAPSVPAAGTDVMLRAGPCQELAPRSAARGLPDVEAGGRRPSPLPTSPHPP